MNVGENLKRFRELRGFTQEYMATELNMSQSNYSKLESNGGKISFELLEKAAAILEVDPMDILSFDEKFIFNIQTQEGSNTNGLVINNFSQKMHELYESRIKSLEEEIKFLRSLLAENKN